MTNPQLVWRGYGRVKLEGGDFSPTDGVAAGVGTLAPSSVASSSLATAAGACSQAEAEGRAAAAVGVSDTLDFLDERLPLCSLVFHLLA